MANEKLGILQLLIENKEEKWSIRQISLQRRINYKSAYQAVKKLEKEGVVNLEKMGNVTLCSFNSKCNSTTFAAEEGRRNEAIRDKKVSAVFSSLDDIPELYIALLFGSQVKGTAARSSDIDLLIISEQVQKIQEELSVLPLQIHITALTLKEFISMLKSKERTIVSEAVKKNIILVGIEDYYRVLGNAF
ncbi:nucleotidyltransferase domain-containing protein [Candidatus Woesearchaeota archaeon]|nr:MAG: Nucleotidyltransferase family protein [archaeon GW2011_AR4]MBS3130627.1 nucleotidyltransferase domain-containing protein [Candidatus Woesearchaeota archaeon]HIH39078.1 nucleotidyltransferase domain-containing protein [Candidatus Woesearchaeota archaeon]HIH49331.1 nucleotidyltransferase domain-containing protein [Candidatus Woesearchaeota archaeon]HIJ03150.1 nucleotidyltransferase domain-containing protein [Candidatus Woesearchaeota archaeon]